MREKKVKLKKQLRDKLRRLWEEGKGKPKHEVKGVHNRSPYIHSYNTYQTYDKWVEAFADWCKLRDIKEWNQARMAVGRFLQEYIDDEYADISAATIRTMAASLGKVFDCTINDFGIKIPKMERAAIRRSRYVAERDKHVSLTHNEELIEFCKSTGLRRSELESLTGVIRYKNGTTADRIVYKDGKAYLRVKGKGGKWRESEIVGTPKQIERVVNRIRSAGDKLVWFHVHTKLDVHSLRADYASTVYLKYARPLEGLEHGEKYFCRGDMAGVVYDRAAMLIASQSLGHERISVIASNYLWGLRYESEA